MSGTTASPKKENSSAKARLTPIASIAKLSSEFPIQRSPKRTKQHALNPASNTQSGATNFSGSAALRNSLSKKFGVAIGLLILQATSSAAVAVADIPVVVDSGAGAVGVSDAVIGDATARSVGVSDLTVRDSLSPAVGVSNDSFSPILPSVTGTVRIFSVVRLGKAWTGNKQNKSEHEFHG